MRSEISVQGSTKEQNRNCRTETNNWNEKFNQWT